MGMVCTVAGSIQAGLNLLIAYDQRQIPPRF